MRAWRFWSGLAILVLVCAGVAAKPPQKISAEKAIQVYQDFFRKVG